nr:MAG: hypothetical protein DIU64_10075 [Caldicoprobacter oshimai]
MSVHVWTRLAIFILPHYNPINEVIFLVCLQLLRVLVSLKKAYIIKNARESISGYFTYIA